VQTRSSRGSEISLLCTRYWTAKTWGELSCSALRSNAAVALPFYLTELISWRLARKNLFLVLTVIREILTLLAILHLEIAKNLFAAGSAEQLNSPPVL